MEIGGAIFILLILIIAIWVVIEIKRMKHKLFAIFLIILILFGYFTFTTAVRGYDVNLTSFSGVVEAGKIYFSWLGYMFGNLKTISTYAFKQDWRNETETPG
jgi:hypothetical protein